VSTERSPEARELLTSHGQTRYHRGSRRTRGRRSLRASSRQGRGTLPRNRCRNQFPLQGTAESPQPHLSQCAGRAARTVAVELGGLLHDVDNLRSKSRPQQSVSHEHADCPLYPLRENSHKHMSLRIDVVDSVCDLMQHDRGFSKVRGFFFRTMVHQEIQARIIIFTYASLFGTWLRLRVRWQGPVVN